MFRVNLMKIIEMVCDYKMSNNNDIDINNSNNNNSNKENQNKKKKKQDRINVNWQEFLHKVQIHDYKFDSCDFAHTSDKGYDVWCNKNLLAI